MIKMMTKTLQNRVSNVGYLTLGLYFRYIRILIWSMQLPRKDYIVLAQRIRSLWITNGPLFTVQYLKEGSRVLNAFVSGNPIFVTNEHPISLVGGLPSIIPGNLRTLLRVGDLGCIRGCLTMFATYRVIKVPCKLKLGTITSPFTGECETLPQYEINKVMSMLPIKRELQNIKLLYLSTAGPNHRVSMLGIWKDILAWSRSPLYPVLQKILLYFPNGGEIKSLIEREIDSMSNYSSPSEGPLYLGRLSIKEEAAGKARVFAITDAITQSVFAPVSKVIFDSLKKIPTDGTFDQNAPLARLRELYKLGDLKGQTFYSYDLSAATDRLPISLQRDVMSNLFGAEFSNLWSEILIGRDWVLKVRGKEPLSLRYSVGQPMGALSSWAMLALTHHVIVLISALRVGIVNFNHYALLGDDIVIANTKVAESYYYIMTSILGVDINLSKSMISERAFEFAKRIVTLDGEVTPVGPKNLLVAVKSTKGIPSVLLDLVNKGFVLPESEVDKMFLNIPASSRSTQDVIWSIKGPFGFVPTADGLTASMRLVSSLTAVRMDSLLSSIDDVIHSVNYRTWKSNILKTVNVKLSFTCLASPDGFESYNDFDHSPVMEYILRDLGLFLTSLVERKPIKRYKFNGPLIFADFYRVTWASEMMKYITKKVKDNSSETVSMFDPFQDEMVILPSSTNSRGINFFKLVRKREIKKSAYRSSL